MATSRDVRPRQPITFNWRAAKHWSKTPRPCIHCPTTTHLRDFAGNPSHKTCAERVANDNVPGAT